MKGEKERERARVTGVCHRRGSWAREKPSSAFNIRFEASECERREVINQPARRFDGREGERDGWRKR